MLDNNIDYHFLVIENALKEMKFDCRVLPHRLEKNLKLIRDELGWVERHCTPCGLPKSVLPRVIEKIIYVSSEKGKNAIAFQIHNVIRRPYVYELVGIKITFGTSENGIPGITFEGTRKDPVITKITEFPWITDDAQKTPKKFAKWIENHEITPKELSEKVEMFSIIDLGLVELNELGLCELDHQQVDEEKIKKEKEKKSKTSTNTPETPRVINLGPNGPNKKPKTYPYFNGHDIFGNNVNFNPNNPSFVSEWGPTELDV